MFLTNISLFYVSLSLFNLLNLLTLQELLDSLPLGNITQTKAVLDSCVYDSLLIVTAQDNSRRAPNIFLFQCEETGVRTLISLLLMLAVKINKHCFFSFLQITSLIS